MRDKMNPPVGSGSPAQASTSDSEIFDVLGHSLSDTENPFSSLSSGGATTSAESLGSAPTDSMDVLEQLRLEAAAALRDPNYISAYARAVAAAVEPRSTQTDVDPLRPPTRAGQVTDSLLELLDGPDSISRLAEPFQSLDNHELFALPPAPDVLRLFAGDIVPTQRQEVTALLTRREHHLLSMDSAYRPSQAQEAQHDA